MSPLVLLKNLDGSASKYVTIMNITNSFRCPGAYKSISGLGLLLFGFGLLMTGCQGWGQPDLDGTPEELYLVAIEKGKKQNFTAAKKYAERAAEQGHACSMQLLASMYFPNKGTVHYSNGARAGFVQWGDQDAGIAREWAGKFVNAVTEKAERGDEDAILYLHFTHKIKMANSPFAFLHSDSLAAVWLEKAYEIDHPYAVRQKAIESIRVHGDLEEGDRLFQKAVELGDENAYRIWSSTDTARTAEPSPDRYFGIVDLALKNEAPGLHEWVGGTLGLLEGQAEKGNEYAMAWMEVADSLRIAERLSEIPERTEDRSAKLSNPYMWDVNMCSEIEASIFQQKPRGSLLKGNKEEDLEVRGLTWDN